MTTQGPFSFGEAPSSTTTGGPFDFNEGGTDTASASATEGNFNFNESGASSVASSTTESVFEFTGGATNIASSDRPSSSGPALSGGAIAGIVLGLLFFFLLGVGAWFVMRRRRKALLVKQIPNMGEKGHEQGVEPTTGVAATSSKGASVDNKEFRVDQRD